MKLISLVKWKWKQMIKVCKFGELEVTDEIDQFAEMETTDERLSVW